MIINLKSNAMRTKIFALLAVLILATVSLGYASSIKEKEVKNLSVYLNRTMKYPGFAECKGLEGNVSLIVRVDENHKLKVTGVKGSCCEFEKFVEEWFNDLAKKPVTFSDQIGIKKVTINFKLI